MDMKQYLKQLNTNDCNYYFVCFNFQSLVAFEKLQKVSASFVVPVCPSVLMGKLGSR